MISTGTYSAIKVSWWFEGFFPLCIDNLSMIMENFSNDLASQYDNISEKFAFQM